MKISIVYSSLTGNTKLLADTIASNIDKDNLIYMGGPSDYALNADIIYVGFWNKIGNCDDSIKQFLNKLNNKKVFLFGTAGFILEQSYLDETLNNVSKNINSTNEIIGKFICGGKMMDSVKQKYLTKLEENPDNDVIRKMLGNWEQVKTHPDKNDLEALKVLIR